MSRLFDIRQYRSSSECKEQQQSFRLEDVSLTAADFEAALGKARASYSQSIGAPNIPNVSWDDVGGLAHVKSDILDTVQLPLDHPELFADGLKKRSGKNLSILPTWLMANLLFRNSPLWSSRNRKNVTCKGSCDFLLIEFLLRQRT